MGFAWASALWPDAVVPMVVKPHFTTIRDSVEAAVAAWSDAGISFVPRTTEFAYVEFRPFPHTQTIIGYSGFKRIVYLGNEASIADVAHELGHVLGLVHEHCRPDRDANVVVNSGLVPVERAEQFAIDRDGTMVGPYDLASIMHYHSFAFADESGPPTITVKDGSLIQKAAAPSSGDISTVLEIYGLT